MRRIGSDADIKEGLTALTSICPHLAQVHALAGDPPLRKRLMGFEGLARVIVGQQLSITSADAIWGRVQASVRPFDSATLLALPDKHLRKAGLSRGKIGTLRELAKAIDSGTLKLGALTRAPEEVIHAELTALKGIGPWTADIYIMFSLARADAWSPGDLALQHAVKDALLLAERPSLVQMNEVAEAWRPWRASPRACSGPIMRSAARALHHPWSRNCRRPNPAVRLPNRYGRHPGESRGPVLDLRFAHWIPAIEP
jgi:DNA-3-methyladenine glycosylase II